MNMEKRDSGRVIFRTRAIITYDDCTINSEVENISMKGMFVISTAVVAIGEDIGVTICLSGSSTELSIRLNGTISRIDDNGFAVVFLQIGLDSYIHLKNIVSYSNGCYAL